MDISQLVNLLVNRLLFPALVLGALTMVFMLIIKRLRGDAKVANDRIFAHTERLEAQNGEIISLLREIRDNTSRNK